MDKNTRDVIESTTMMGLLAIVLWRNCTTFDMTEIKSLAEFLFTLVVMRRGPDIVRNMCGPKDIPPF